ncbi:MAG: GNAT family N-acyltransferase [Candidatus Sumerlaeia bacterium]|nr:GNAT family N-acyltransferase [Candidatus Sumerlaeia bacterium]
MADTLLFTAGDLRVGPLEGAEQLAGPLSPQGLDVLTLAELCRGRYCAGFAVSRAAIEETLRLRYRVFNLELGEGLAESHLTGMDRDRFDDQMTHMVVIDRQSQRIVGTYRMQTASEAMAAQGLYSAQEYDMAPLAELFPETVELGRACVDAEHRSFATVMLLWAGIRAYARVRRQRYLTGCCSLTTTDPDEGWRAMKLLRRKGHLDPGFMLRATPAYSCGPAEREFDADVLEMRKLPKLFSAYLRLGCTVISEPAIDRDFQTVDFLILLDTYKVNFSSLTVAE